VTPTNHHIVRRCPGRCGHPRGQDSPAVPAGELLRRTVRAHDQSRTHRPHPDRQRAALACGAHQTTFGTTTVDDPTTPANCTHHGWTTPWPTSARHGSNVTWF